MDSTSILVLTFREAGNKVGLGNNVRSENEAGPGNNVEPGNEVGPENKAGPPYASIYIYLHPSCICMHPCASICGSYGSKTQSPDSKLQKTNIEQMSKRIAFCISKSARTNPI